MNEQLDLFDWALVRSGFSDIGGRCGWCLESGNWLVNVDQEAVCQTACYDLDTLMFVEICGKTKYIGDL